MKITFLGAAGEVTGSQHLIETAHLRILLDCGLFQGHRAEAWHKNKQFRCDPRNLDAVILSHAHIDHSGNLPNLVKQGYEGPIYATRVTAHLSNTMLLDSGHIHESDAAYVNKKRRKRGERPVEPLYTLADAMRVEQFFQGVDYDEAFEVIPGVQARLVEAGHILGSAAVTVDIATGTETRRIVFSGDIGRYGAPILPDPMPIEEAEYVVVESTYGDRRHDPEPIPQQLERVISDAVKRGGAIIVPAFAIGRTQELMYHLSGLEKAGRIPRLPAYLDSPMAIGATEIYCAHPEDFEGDMRRMVMDRNCPLHCGDFRLARSPDESRAINEIKGPVVIISASGMVTGGRVLHHLRLRLPDARTTVLLVGYQATGTRGWLLQNGASSVRIFGEDIPVRARVETIHGLSAHADADGLIRWLRTAARPPKRVFVVHGDPEPAKSLAERIKTELGWEATVPKYRDRAQID